MLEYASSSVRPTTLGPPPAKASMLVVVLPRSHTCRYCYNQAGPDVIRDTLLISVCSQYLLEDLANLFI